MKKIINYLKLIFNAKWKIKRPLKKKYLIFGNNTNIISSIIKSNYFCLDHENRTLYLELFLKIFFNFSYKNFLYKYYLSIIEVVDPEIIIFSIDTNTFFWKLKNYFPEKKLILIQNAKKTGSPSDLFFKLKNLKFQKQKVDYIFLMNGPIKNEFKKYLEGKFIVHGLMQNNSIKKNVVQKQNYAFISQISDYGDSKFDNISKKKLNETFYEATKRLLKYFSKYKPGIKMNIFLYNSEIKLVEYEKSIYKKICNELNLKINFISKSDKFSNYGLLDKFECIIGITSTLLYENFSRGNKTGFFNYLKNHNINGYDLSWPLKENETVISTEQNDFENFERIMKYLDECTNIEWNNTVSNLKENIMIFDEDNQQFRNLIINLN